jgi:hypothetical protein|tara:strand:+ start:1034 stop:1297 length:264 start_codon:yes stop_codon:yes gene_type:complete
MKKQPLKEMFNKIGGNRLNTESINEADYTKVTIPAQVKRWMGKFVSAVKEANLNKIKRIAILFAIIKALGISKQELQQYIQRIKREV